MNGIRHLALLTAFALLLSAPPSRAQPEQEDKGQPTVSRKIVRVISTNDESPRVEIEEGERIVVTDEDGAFSSVFVDQYSRKRGYLGVETIDLTPELRRHFGAPSDAGVMISRVVEASPAAEGGLEPADILIALDGEKLSSGTQLERTISPLADQTDVNLKLQRGNATRTLRVTIVARERPAIDLGRLALSGPGVVHELVWVGDEDGQKRVLTIDSKGLEDALHDLEVHIDKPEFIEQFGPLGQTRLELQQRILELEQRLESLERQLEAFSDN